MPADRGFFFQTACLGVLDQSCESMLPEVSGLANLQLCGQISEKSKPVNWALKETVCSTTANVHLQKCQNEDLPFQNSRFNISELLFPNSSFQITIYKLSNLENKLTHHENGDTFEILTVCWHFKYRSTAVKKKKTVFRDLTFFSANENITPSKLGSNLTKPFLFYYI